MSVAQIARKTREITPAVISVISIITHFLLPPRGSSPAFLAWPLTRCTHQALGRKPHYTRVEHPWVSFTVIPCPWITHGGMVALPSNNHMHMNMHDVHIKQNYRGISTQTGDKGRVRGNGGPSARTVTTSRSFMGALMGIRAWIRASGVSIGRD